MFGTTPSDIAKLFFDREQYWRETKGMFQSSCDKDFFEMQADQVQQVEILAAKDVLMEIQKLVKDQQEETRQELSKLEDQHATDIMYKEKIQEELDIDTSGSDTHGSWDYAIMKIKDIRKGSHELASAFKDIIAIDPATFQRDSCLEDFKTNLLLAKEKAKLLDELIALDSEGSKLAIESRFNESQETALRMLNLLHAATSKYKVE